MAVMAEMGELLGTSEVARRLGVSESTVARLADRGALPSFRLTPTSPRRFRTEDVAELLERAEGRAA
jgi:excisionase family DNA binding protein